MKRRSKLSGQALKAARTAEQLCQEIRALIGENLLLSELAQRELDEAVALSKRLARTALLVEERA